MVTFLIALFRSVPCRAVPLRYVKGFVTLLSVPERTPLVWQLAAVYSTIHTKPVQFLPRCVFAVPVSQCIPLGRLFAPLVVGNPQNNVCKHRKQTNSDATIRK